MGLHVLVVGAHPDDIEIAAGGTTALLARHGADVLAVVATDETDAEIARIRRSEARAGLEALGVDPTAIRFLGLPDRSVEADGGARRLRQLVDEHEFTPDVVISHSFRDNHSDHRSVSMMVDVLFRDRSPILYMGVVNSIQRGFRPTFFVDTTEFRSLKATALRAHCSQDALGRIRPAAIRTMEAENAWVTGFACAEGFELADEEQRLDAAVIDWFAPCRLFDADHPQIGSARRSGT